jgi:hypothetical protein
VIRRISTSFVPVALNLYKIREQKDAAGDFFRSAQRQRPNYQGFWIATAQGKVIGAHQQFKDHETWTQEVIETLDAALKDFGPVEPRAVRPIDPLPHRGVGLQPDGTACLSVYFCALYGGKREAPPWIDSIVLGPAEMSALAPPRAEAGHEWSVADAVARKFCRAISGSADTSHMPAPEDVTHVKLQGKVQTVQGDRVHVRLTGRWEAVQVYAYDEKKRPTYSSSKAEGLLIFDAKTRSVESLLLVFNGTWRNVAPYDHPPADTGAVVEWRR